VAACRECYTERPKGPGLEEPRNDPFPRMRRAALGLDDEVDLTLAAWLHRLGHDELAAKALAEARKRDMDIVARPRSGLAWHAFAGLVHAYMVRADAEALTHGERLLRLYSEEAKKEFAQGPLVMAELKRRKEKGSFGVKPDAKEPAGFDKWDTAKKLAH